MEYIYPNELKQRIDNREKLFILDVREEWEYDEENIGAKNIPLCAIPQRIDELKFLQNAEIICHCRTGRRSHQAAKYLTKNGFTNVRSLEGGMEAYVSLLSAEQD